MLTGEMARYRIDDRVRAAQADRLAKSTRTGRTADARSGARRVGGGGEADPPSPIGA
jgi:hypothetical protein